MWLLENMVLKRPRTVKTSSPQESLALLQFYSGEDTEDIVWRVEGTVKKEVSTLVAARGECLRVILLISSQGNPTHNASHACVRLISGDQAKLETLAER